MELTPRSPRRDVDVHDPVRSPETGEMVSLLETGGDGGDGDHRRAPAVAARSPRYDDHAEPTSLSGALLSLKELTVGSPGDRYRADDA